VIAAQSAMAVHACSLALSGLPMSPPSEVVVTASEVVVTASEDGLSGGSGNGAGVPIQGEDPVALCHFHCKGDPQIDAHADAPTAPIAPQPALMVVTRDQRLPASAAMTLLPVRSSAPPPLILFSRFL